MTVYYILSIPDKYPIKAFIKYERSSTKTSKSIWPKNLIA